MSNPDSRACSEEKEMFLQNVSRHPGEIRISLENVKEKKKTPKEGESPRSAVHRVNLTTPSSQAMLKN